MDDTMWFDRTPAPRGGMLVLQGSKEHGDPTTLLMTPPEAMPDWVRLPKRIGGAILKPLRQFAQECPCCKNGQPVRHIQCEQNYFVAECVVHGFAWYKAL